MAKKTFAQWRKAVDEQICKRVGLNADDLPDYDYVGAYESGRAPAGVASSVIRAARDY